MKALTFFNYFTTFIKFLIYKLATSPSSIKSSPTGSNQTLTPKPTLLLFHEMCISPITHCSNLCNSQSMQMAHLCEVYLKAFLPEIGVRGI